LLADVSLVTAKLCRCPFLFLFLFFFALDGLSSVRGDDANSEAMTGAGVVFALDKPFLFSLSLVESVVYPLALLGLTTPGPAADFGVRGSITRIMFKLELVNKRDLCRQMSQSI